MYVSLKMKLNRFLCSFLIWLTCYKIEVATNLFNLNKLGAQPRSLIFPVTAPTRIQFIGGIGIPVEDLAYESVTSGYVLKAEYFLPYEAGQLRPNYLKPQLIHRRSINESHHEHILEDEKDKNKGFNRNDNFRSQQKNGSAYRWIIYRSIEIVLERAKKPGRACLLRSICEHAALPLNYESGMLAEILHIVLTPSTSCDILVNAANKDYLRAEKLGHMGANCEAEFSECIQSPMDQISTILNLTE